MTNAEKYLKGDYEEFVIEMCSLVSEYNINYDSLFWDLLEEWLDKEVENE